MTHDMPEKEEFFAPRRRFSDSINTPNILILDEDTEIFGKALRAGSVLRIIAWREVKDVPYLIVSKGTWESLVEYEKVAHLIES